MITGRSPSCVWRAVFCVLAGAKCVPRPQAHFSLTVFPARIHPARYGWDGVTLPDGVLRVPLPLRATLVGSVYASGLATQERSARHQRQSVIP